MHVYIEDIGAHEGEEVTIKGWLHNRRSSGKIHFLIVRDGSGFIQAVMSKAAVGDELFKAADHLSQETSVIVTGTARADKRAPSGYEIDVKQLEVVGDVARLPDHARRSTASTTCSIGGICGSARERQQAILRVRHEIINAVRDFFNGARLHPRRHADLHARRLRGHDDAVPGRVFRGSDGVSDAERSALHRGQRDGARPRLLVSARRSAPRNRRRAATSPSSGWSSPRWPTPDLDDVMNLAEDLVVSVVARVLDKRRRELKVLERDVDQARSRAEAVSAHRPTTTPSQTLQAKGLPIEWGGDFGGPDETALSEQFDRPVMVHRYPAAVKAFYMKPDPERPELALGVDVLAPEGYGEIIGGGERLADLDLLLQRIKEHNLPQEAFEWYLDLRRYGTVPHGGFGMGIERVVAWICRLEHVRETIPYPRMLYRMYP